jgi:hypothetical protein
MSERNNKNFEIMVRKATNFTVSSLETNLVLLCVIDLAVF